MLKLIEAVEKAIKTHDCTKRPVDRDGSPAPWCMCELGDLDHELKRFLVRMAPLSKKMTLLGTFAGFSKAEVEGLQRKIAEFSKNN